MPFVCICWLLCFVVRCFLQWYSVTYACAAFLFRWISWYDVAFDFMFMFNCIFSSVFVKLLHTVFVVSCTFVNNWSENYRTLRGNLIIVVIKKNVGYLCYKIRLKVEPQYPIIADQCWGKFPWQLILTRLRQTSTKWS